MDERQPFYFSVVKNLERGVFRIEVLLNETVQRIVGALDQKRGIEITLNGITVRQVVPTLGELFLLVGMIHMIVLRRFCFCCINFLERTAQRFNLALKDFNKRCGSLVRNTLSEALLADVFTIIVAFLLLAAFRKAPPIHLFDEEVAAIDEQLIGKAVVREPAILRKAAVEIPDASFEAKTVLRLHPLPVSYTVAEDGTVLWQSVDWHDSALGIKPLS